MDSSRGVLAWIAAGAGVLLVYAGIRNKTVLDEIRTWRGSTTGIGVSSVVDTQAVPTTVDRNGVSH